MREEREESFSSGEWRSFILWKDGQRVGKKDRWLTYQSRQCQCHCQGHYSGRRCSLVCQVGEGMGGERERGGKAYLRAMLWWRYSMDDGDSVVLSKQGQSKRTLSQWRVQRRGSILRETRRQTMLGRQDQWEILCPDADFLSLWGWKHNLVLTTQKAINESGCVIEGVGRRFKVKVSSGCKKSNGSFTGYQRCGLSVILLLEDHSDEHYTARYPLIDIEASSWIALFSAQDFSEPVCYQLWIEWKILENNVGHSRVSSIIIISHHPSQKLRCWNGSLVSSGIKFHHSFNLWYWTADIRWLTLITFFGLRATE